MYAVTMRPSIPRTKNRCPRPAAIKGMYRIILPSRLVHFKYWRYRERGPFVNAATQRSFSTTPSPINDSLHPTQTRDCYLWNDDRLQITQSLAAHVESQVPTFAALHRITRATWSDVRNLAMGNLSLDYHLWATCLRNYCEIVATAALRGLAHTTLHHQP